MLLFIEQMIDKYIEYYNFERLQVKCGSTLLNGAQWSAAQLNSLKY